MSDTEVEKQEKILSSQLQQTMLDQEDKESEIRKHEHLIEEFHHFEQMEQNYYSDVLEIQFDERTQNLLQQSTEEAQWLAREENEYLDEKAELLHQEKRLLLEQEDHLLQKRKQLFANEGSDAEWG